MSKQLVDVGKGLVIGGIIGVATGVLLAPKSGKETREEIRMKAKEMSVKTKEECEKTLQRTKKAYDAVTSHLKRAKGTEKELAEG